MTDLLLNKFLGALGRMSRRDLYELAAALRSEEQRNAMVSLLTGAAAMKGVRTESEKRRPQIKVEKSSRRESESMRATSEDFDDLRDSFFAVLSDREAFPSTRDLIAAMNSCFRFNWRYNELKRESRERLLSRAWAKLAALPKAERIANLRTFCDHYQKLGAVDEYKELFKLLSRSE